MQGKGETGTLCAAYHQKAVTRRKGSVKNNLRRVSENSFNPSHLNASVAGIVRTCKALMTPVSVLCVVEKALCELSCKGDFHCILLCAGCLVVPVQKGSVVSCAMVDVLGRLHAALNLECLHSRFPQGADIGTQAEVPHAERPEFCGPVVT